MAAVWNMVIILVTLEATTVEDSTAFKMGVAPSVMRALHRPQGADLTLATGNTFKLMPPKAEHAVLLSRTNV